MTLLPQPVNEGAARTRKTLSQARHLPAHFYTSPEIYEREKERIFQKEWLCMGRVEELDQPGDYLTFRVAGEPVVVCKDADGKLRAFSNVCRHRGTQVAFGESDCGTPFGKGCDRAFSCPYHGWIYDLQGKLINAPHSKEMALILLISALFRSGWIPGRDSYS
jgi:Rieske 2Fe-2S family protein